MPVPESLDPADWGAFRALAHRALDDALDGLENVRARPVWQAVPDAVKASLRAPLPREPTPLDELYRTFTQTIAPYPTGNTHPRFFGWVHGSGTAVGVIAEMLAAAMNANVGGRDHGAVYVERQVLEWSKELFGYPGESSGILVTGTSVANLIAVSVARTRALDSGAEAGSLVAYTSSAAHVSIRKALRTCGFSPGALRVVPVDADHRIDVTALRHAIDADRAAGFFPFFIAGTAGSVDVGAIDNLNGLADAARDAGAWFHVDGAFGALAILDPAQAPKLAGIERSDSLAFDFHKWLHVPYDAGCVLVRDAGLHRRTFAADAAYLQRTARGIAGGEPWFTDFGPDLSRGFRALKVWFAFMHYGSARLGAAIARNCAQARRFADAIQHDAEFELLAPVQLDIVCFRFCPAEGADADAINDEIAIALAEAGEAVVSTTRLAGKRALRVNLTNHRTSDEDLVEVLEATRKHGRRLSGR